MDNLRIENTEIESQSHKMWAEGSCDNPTSQLEVAGFMLQQGWIVRNIQYWHDDMQGFYRWNCDLYEKI
jgi:hypothetical protein